MNNGADRKTRPASSRAVQAEIRQIQAAERKVIATKESARRFLAATGMYSPKGRLKPRFS